MKTHTAAAEELQQMRLRLRQVEDALKETEAEEARLLAELGKVDAQAGYYDSLAGDMKRDVHPGSLSGLVRSLRR